MTRFKGSDEYLGQVTFRPLLGPVTNQSSLLSWKAVQFGDYKLGDLSIGAELLPVSKNNLLANDEG